MAQIIIQGVNFVVSPNSPQTVTIKYRKTGDPDVPSSYTVVSTSTVVAIDGTITPNVALTGLDNDTSYNVVISNNCSGRARNSVIITQDLTTYVWLEDTYICEQDGLISQVLQAAGFSSPMVLFHDEVQNRIYVVDADSASGNIYWFTPSTFTGIASVTYTSAVALVNKTIYDSTVSVDIVRRKIYIAGFDSSGLIVYDIDTDTAITSSQNSALAYGSNSVPFDRLLVRQLGDQIYCSYSGGASLVIFNANTLVQTFNGPITGIPSGSLALSGSYNIYEVGNERWVVPAAGRSDRRVFIYNQTLTNLVSGTSTIDLPDSAIPTWGSGKYWGQGYYDAGHNKFYYHDIGGSVTYIIDTVTRTIAKKIFWTNKEGKTYAQIDFSYDKNIGRLYFNYTGFNAITDATSTRKKRSYIIDRVGLNLDKMFPTLVTSGLVPQTGSKFLFSANRGLARWDGGSWSTDGLITKLTY